MRSEQHKRTCRNCGAEYYQYETPNLAPEELVDKVSPDPLFCLECLITVKQLPGRDDLVGQGYEGKPVLEEYDPGAQKAAEPDKEKG